MALPVDAQRWDALWKQVDEARKADLPRTEIEALQQIERRAQAQKAYGQLLKARTQRAGLEISLSPDSIEPITDQLRQETEAAEQTGDGALAAVMNTVMGTLYADRTDMLDDVNRDSATWFFRRALSDMPLLARTKALGFKPMVETGRNSDWFDNDLLSVIGLQAAEEDYEEALPALHQFYDSTGNRRAALYLACRMGQDADSLIARYGDMQECGLAAERKWDTMYSKTVAERVAFAREAISRWPRYHNVNVFKNHIARLTQPTFSAEVSQAVVTPHQESRVRLHDLRHISSLRMRVIDKQTKAVVMDETHSYSGYAPYDVHEDSMLIKPLPLGKYWIEMSTDNAVMKKDTTDYYVTNLSMIALGLPDNRRRIFVLDATTGKPVAGAKIELSRDHPKTAATKVLTTDEQGMYEGRIENGYHYRRAYTADDTAMPKASGGWWGRYHFSTANGTRHHLNIYTDRAIYRPGQTLRASVLVFDNTNGKIVSPVAGREVTLRLCDANGKTVSQQALITDVYGTASAEFVLPEGRLTGRFSLRSDEIRTTRFFRVEEYKRPTFEVTFEKVKTAYAAGDTIVVKGMAKSFAGVAVQGAKVSYTVKRNERYCWWGRNAMGDELAQGETTTDQDGHFEVSVPLTTDDDNDDELPTWCRTRFYRFVVDADVTDQGGETRHGTTTLPLGTHPTALYVDLPDKQLKDSMRTLIFYRENAAGERIDGTVSYVIDDGTKHTAKANETISLSCAGISLTSGRHTLEATCGEDTLKQEFVLFSLDDECPPVETHDWFYQSAGEFGDRPVSVIVGTSDADVRVYYSLFSGNKELDHGTFDLSNSNRRLDFDYKESYGDGVRLVMAWVKDGHTYTHTADIKKPLPNKRLITKWTTFRDRLTPGQEETWTLRITRPDGTAARAQLMAVLFDKSLDEIEHHEWNLQLGLTRHLPNVEWDRLRFWSAGLNGNAPWKSLKLTELSFSRFCDAIHVARYSHRIFVRGMGRPMLGAAKTMNMAVMNATVSDEAELSESMAMSSAAAVAPETAMMKRTNADGNDVEEATEANASSSQLRENLQETAFFYPALETDGKGDVALKFRLPESVTTWRFIGLTHDKEMDYGLTEAEAVAQKDVMVMPNMPRFVREGDIATITARIVSMADRHISGTARLQILDPETEQMLIEQRMPFSVTGKNTTSVSFKVNTDDVMLKANCMQNLFVCRIYAEGGGFSDGEQHYLPVLPNKEMVTNTLPFTQHGAGTLTIPMERLFGNAVSTDNAVVTAEYTDNPAWLMMQALPYVDKAHEDNAISLAASYYANSLGKHILSQNPKMKSTFELWKKEQGNETSLMSALDKNQELKSLVIDETPWVNDAKHESDGKLALANFFDDNALAYQLDRSLKGLRRLQNADGSFPWWKGMNGSAVMTAEVMEFLTRLNLLTEEEDNNTREMLNKAHRFLSSVVVKEVKELMQREKEGKPVYINDWHALQWVYLCALENRTLNKDEQMAKTYLMNHLEKQKLSQSLYAKAMMAVVLTKDGQTAKSSEYIQSLLEYTVYKDEMGRYYDTPRAGYSWCDYRIPTQTAVIEALQLSKTMPNGYEEAVEEMQRWLLQEKRTQAWDTPINSVNAVYAFLNGRTTILNPQTPTVLKMDDKTLDTSKATVGLGYTKIRLPEGRVKKSSVFTAKRTSEVTGWGALYAQFMQPITDVEDRGEGLRVKREMLSNATTLHVGDKVKVRLTIQAERDYDFVQLIDKRAACLEPISQLSGYHWGYYIAPKDNATCYYFDCLRKGKHVIETEYYVDRIGNYQTGTCTIQCAYAPEYMARTKAVTLEVK